VTILKRDMFENGKAGDQIGATNSIFDLSGHASITFAEDQPAALAKGRRAAKLNLTGANSAQASITSTTGPVTIRAYFYFTTDLTGTGLAMLRVLSGGTSRARLFMSTGESIQIHNGTTAVGTSSPAATLNQLYRIEWSVWSANSTQKVAIYTVSPGGAETLFHSTSGAYTGSLDRLSMGSGTAVTALYYVDALVISDQYTEVGPVNRQDMGLPLAA
jgi:hypothetical protein